MYNGIGLSTARGSATSGHIQKNLSYVKPEFFRQKVQSVRSNGFHTSREGGAGGGSRPIDPVIVDHNRKFAIEAKVFEYQLELEEEGGLSEEAIQEKCSTLRERLLSGGNEVVVRRVGGGGGGGGGGGQVLPTDSHQIAIEAEKKNNRLREALGIEGNFPPGSSFDVEQQEERRRLARERRAAEVEERRGRARRGDSRERPAYRGGGGGGGGGGGEG
eukprot:gene10994-12241_t